MKTIDEILTEQEFTSAEKAVFIGMLSHAKTLQKSMNLDQLKQFMNQQIDKMLDNHEDTKN